MMAQAAILPVYEGPCIRCKERRPGGTPFLCLRCLRITCRDYMRQKIQYRYMGDELFDVAAKRFQNEIQKHSRQSFKRIQSGLNPLTPPGF
jgi:hypothetical protein